MIAKHLTVSEAAEYLRLQIQTLHNWRSKGRGPAYIKIGGKILYRKDDLDTFIDSGRVTPGVANAN